MSSALTVAQIGCATSPEGDDGPLGEDESALEGSNGLSPNGLSPNGIHPNGLSPNGLNPSALSAAALAPGALDASALAAIQRPDSAGDLSRMFLKYAVGCALTPSQSFAFSWSDSAGAVHNEVYPGLVGTAPGWATAPLTLAGQQMVSACLAARTNWYGVQVTISMRYFDGILKIVNETTEHLVYPYVEGAFWGNVFAQTPYVRACYTAPNVAHSRAALRDCAAGHLDGSGGTEACGMIEVVGSCSSACSAPLVSSLLGVLGQYYPECDDPDHPSTRYVMTTALP